MTTGANKLLRLSELRARSVARALSEASSRCEEARAALAKAQRDKQQGKADAAKLRETLREAGMGQSMERAVLARFLERLDQTRATEIALETEVQRAEQELQAAKASHAKLRECFLKAHADEKKRAALAKLYATRDAKMRRRREDLLAEGFPGPIRSRP